jgi:hypothetical protein
VFALVRAMAQDRFQKIAGLRIAAMVFGNRRFPSRTRCSMRIAEAFARANPDYPDSLTRPSAPNIEYTDYKSSVFSCAISAFERLKQSPGS